MPLPMEDDLLLFTGSCIGWHARRQQATVRKDTVGGGKYGCIFSLPVQGLTANFTTREHLCYGVSYVCI